MRRPAPIPLPLAQELRGRSHAALALAAVLVGGCAHKPLWDRIDSSWQTVTSEHFVLHTDLWQYKYSDVIERLEDVYAALSVSLFKNARVPAVQSLLLSNEDYEALVGTPTAGMFLPRVGDPGGLLLIRDSPNRLYVDAVAAHEMVHRFIAAQFPRMPVWLNEGIASYLETISVRNDAVVLGLLPPRPMHGFGADPIVSLRGLANARRADFHGRNRSANYYTAGAFVHWMLHARSTGAGAQWWKLIEVYGSEGTVRETPDEVIARLFPELTWPEIEARVQQHVDRAASSPSQRVWMAPFQRPARAPLQVAPADGARLKKLCLDVYQSLH